MRMISKIGILIVCTIVLLFVSSVNATIEDLLPESSEHQGSTYYSEYDDASEKWLRGRIDFAVYDTETSSEWTDAGFAVPGLGRYVYAYQIFNDYDGYSDLSVASFSLLDINEDLVTGTSYEYDQFEGVDPTAIPSEGAWEFSLGVLYAGKHSSFLIFSSDRSWVAGSYEITPTEDTPLVVPDSEGGENPEPATIALLGLGFSFVLRSRNKRH